MSSFEAMARETAHPLFDELKVSIWELVPATVKDSVGGLLGDKPDAVAEVGCLLQGGQQCVQKPPYRMLVLFL